MFSVGSPVRVARIFGGREPGQGVAPRVLNVGVAPLAGAGVHLERQPLAVGGEARR